MTNAFKVQCVKCPQSLLFDDLAVRDQDVDESFHDWEIEIWNDILPAMTANGWSQERTRHGFNAICPSCADAIVKPIMEKFSLKSMCKMCGFNKIDTKYCDGHLLCSGGVQDHLHRTCKRCSYDWVMSPKSIKETLKDHAVNDEKEVVNG